MASPSGCCRTIIDGAEFLFVRSDDMLFVHDIPMSIVSLSE